MTIRNAAIAASTYHRELIPSITVFYYPDARNALPEAARTGRPRLVALTMILAMESAADTLAHLGVRVS